MNQAKKTLKSEIENFIFDWGLFPFDFWWRKKYNIPFGSKSHREMNFIDMAIEWEEEHILMSAHERKENEELGLYNKNTNVINLTEKEIDEDYENLDLSQFNDKQNG